MSKYSKCDKFVALLEDDGPGEGISYFYIIDVDTWNKKHCVRDVSDYSEKVYDAIAQLGFDCGLAAENVFEVSKDFSSTEDLEEFLKDLPWIRVIDWEDKYVDPETIARFGDKTGSRKIDTTPKAPAKKKLGKPVLKESDETFLVSATKHSQNNPDKVFVDYTIMDSVKSKGEKYSHNQSRAVNDIFASVYSERMPYLMAANETDSWIEFMLENEKTVLCLAKNPEVGLLIAFDDKEAMDAMLNKSQAYVELKNMLEEENDSENDL